MAMPMPYVTNCGRSTTSACRCGRWRGWCVFFVAESTGVRGYGTIRNTSGRLVADRFCFETPGIGDESPMVHVLVSMLPAMGHGTTDTCAHASAEDFQAARRAHPAVQSAIHALECHGRPGSGAKQRQGRLRTHGRHFDLVFNVDKLGSLLRSQA